TGKQRTLSAGVIVEHGVGGPGSCNYDVSARGAVSAGGCRIPQSIFPSATLRDGEPVTEIPCLWLRREPDLFRLFLSRHRAPDPSVGVPSKDDRCADADRRTVLFDE